VALIRRAASGMPDVFQVGVICKHGSVCEPVSEQVMLSGTAVEPAAVAICARY